MIAVADRPELPPLHHAWRGGISVGRAFELLRADLQDHLRLLQREIGYRHIRFHASFDDDMAVVHRRPDGALAYTWHHLDQVYDFLVDAGFDPIVELNPMPRALASGEATMFWYRMNITPPRDYGEWHDLVLAATRHFLERYGGDRVRNWLFEVWNEPNLKDVFWTGDQADYFRLYEAAARAVKAASRELRVGGPAGATPAWNLPLARHCRDHGIPLDFISFHGYPAGEYCQHPGRQGSPAAPGKYLLDEFRGNREAMAREGFAHLPQVVTEWNTLTCGPDGHAQWVGCSDVSTLYAAAATCHYAVGADDLADVLTWWTASDIFEESGRHLEPYGSGNSHYGLLTIDGLPKPPFHAFRFLARMRGPRFALDLGQSGPSTRGGIATDDAGVLRILLWNFHPPEQPDSPWHDTVTLPVPERLRGHRALRLVSARVGEGCGSAYESWAAMGRPGNPSRSEQDLLAQHAQPHYATIRAEVAGQRIALAVSLARNELLFLEVVGPADPNAPGTNDAVAQAHAELNRKLDIPS